MLVECVFVRGRWVVVVVVVVRGGVTSAVTLWQWCSGWEAAVGRL